MTAISVEPSTEALLLDCLAFDHLAVSGDLPRRDELTGAAHEGMMRVAVVDHRAAGYAIVSSWFFGAPFLALVYVDAEVRGRGVGDHLVADFEERHDSRKLFTSTNLSNAPMQRLLRRRGWIASGLLHGLDEGDPEIFFLRSPGTASL